MINMRARESLLRTSSSLLPINIGVVDGVSTSYKSESLDYNTFEFLPPRVCQLYSNCINRERGNATYYAADTSFLLRPIVFFMGG